MVEVVGVRFRDAGHIYYYAPGKTNIFIMIKSWSSHSRRTRLRQWQFQK